MSWPQIATYVSYVFIVVLYAFKVIKVARMPVHLRWDLYPIPHETGHKYGGSYFEELEWWTRPRRKSVITSVIYMLKKYFLLAQYYQGKRIYWFVLYPWHIGFYLIVCFHILCFLGAFIMLTTGLTIGPASPDKLGISLYYLTVVIAISSFITGSIGSIGLLIERLTIRDLRDYASPANYFNYLFFLAVFMSGLVSWYFFDLTLAGYREFWKSLFTFQYMHVEPATYVHIMLFSLFLMYLPFTRSTHYITIFFSYFRILWDDKPNTMGSEIERKVKALLNNHISWSAPHIQSGKKWSEVISEGIETNYEESRDTGHK